MDSTPHLTSNAMRKRFANWEEGFNLFEAGHPIERCHVNNHNVRKSLVEGWKAAACVEELAKDAQAMAVFTRSKKRFNGTILL